MGYWTMNNYYISVDMISLKVWLNFSHFVNNNEKTNKTKLIG